MHCINLLFACAGFKLVSILVDVRVFFSLSFIFLGLISDLWGLENKILGISIWICVWNCSYKKCSSKCSYDTQRCIYYDNTYDMIICASKKNGAM